MTFLPIVTRELRVRARAAGTYRVRLGAGGGAVLIVASMLILGWLSSAMPRMGAGMFVTLAWLAFLFCLLEGLRNTADCLSEEKRAGTLGLLFLTDLNGSDVVLGKLIATSLNSFYGLLAIFPALAIPLLLGGVSGGEFTRLVVTLPLTLLFSLALGLFVSAISRDAQRAWTATAGLLIFFAALPGLDALFGLSWGNPALSRFSPLTPFLLVWDDVFQRHPGLFWPSVGLVLLVCAALLAAASWMLPRAWQDRSLEERKSPRRATSASVPTEREQALRAELLQINPVLWLASRHDSLRRYLWMVVSVAGTLGLIAWLTHPGNDHVMGTIFFAAILLHFLIAVWVAACACQSLADARNSGALELLLATPLTEQQIIYGHHRALRRVFGPPVKMLLAVEAVLLFGQLVYRTLPGHSDASFVIAFLIAVGFIAMFITDLMAAGWVGLWYGLVTPRPANAVAKTVLHVLVLPTLLLLCCYVFWPVLALVKNQILANWAEGRLTREFRSIVTGRFTDHAPSRTMSSPLPPVIPK